MKTNNFIKFMNTKNNYIKKYGFIFFYYIFEYFLSFLIVGLIWKLGISKHLLSDVIIAITYKILPAVLLIWIAVWYKNYSLKSFFNVFLASFLVGIPPIHLAFFAYSTIDWSSTLLKQNFIIMFGSAALFSLFVGLAGLLLNSVYILILRILKKT